MASFKILRSEPFFDRALDAVKFLPILLVAPSLLCSQLTDAGGSNFDRTSSCSVIRLVWVNTVNLSLSRCPMVRKTKNHSSSRCTRPEDFEITHSVDRDRLLGLATIALVGRTESFRRSMGSFN